MLLIIAVSNNIPWRNLILAGTDGGWVSPWWASSVGGIQAAKPVSDSDEKSKYHIFGIAFDGPVKVHDDLRIGIRSDGRYLVINGTIGSLKLVDHEIPITDLSADEETLDTNPKLKEFFEKTISVAESLNAKPGILVIDPTGMSTDMLVEKLAQLFGINLQEPSDRPDEQPQ
ncbi:MAG: hypothetical protein A3B68_03030 [Candidatus Melainabacteria bacterium RIFCSPHIGHO2_02_FULL_34_12]|nr:MAG: hypothetical protein A3B68_03030 [Candidatus Melainabacteria bacterium RIFCSPHIGHO2_02_FULL_34_12]